MFSLIVGSANIQSLVANSCSKAVSPLFHVFEPCTLSPTLQYFNRNTSSAVFDVGTLYLIISFVDRIDLSFSFSMKICEHIVVELIAFQPSIPESE